MQMEAIAEKQPEADGKHQRRATNAMIQPFLQFKLLFYMLGTTILVALLLGTFLYVAFSDLIQEMYSGAGVTDYYSEMIQLQLVHLFRYCGVLFVLYIGLLAFVCIAYTHKLLGPFQPFNRHVDSLIEGDYTSRVGLRKGDPDLFREYAEKLNALAEKLDNNRQI